MSRSVLVIALCLPCAVACEDPLVDPATVIAPRIVGARVRAAGDAMSAEPRAGEGASIDWLVISNGAGSATATAAFCRAEPSSLGAPRCAASAFDERALEVRFGEPLTLDFSLPGSLAEEEPWLAWLGACTDAGAAPSFDAESSAFACAGSGEVLSAFYRGRVPSAAPNGNPVLADDEILLAGEPWPASEADSAAGAACADRTLPSVRPGDELQIAFALGGDDREPLPVIEDEYAPHARESLVYTHIASVPGLDRAFSAIDFDSDAAGFALPFSIPSDTQPGAGGETINFHLLVRDERGGVDWTRRDACLLPAASGGT